MRSRDYYARNEGSTCRRRTNYFVPRLSGSLEIRFIWLTGLATAVVVHPGEVPVDKHYEPRMRALYTERKERSSEHADVRERFIEDRMKSASLHLEALRRSLLELVEDAEALGVRLGLENRDHYNEIPLPDELDELLALRPGTIEYWHDTGHAEKLG